MADLPAIRFPITPAEPDWLAGLRGEIAVLGSLSGDWGGSERPSETAIQVAIVLVEATARSDRRPARVAPMADGGIAVRFVQGQRRARFDIYNDGGVVLVSQPSREAAADVRSMDPLDAARSLVEYLK